MMRPVYFSLGWIFVVLGIVGAFLPIMPTTPFMLLALWAFANSSLRFHDWLYHHRLFGPPLQQWKQYRVIPMTAKIMAVTMMSTSFVYLVFFTRTPFYVDIVVGMGMLFAVYFIVSKPSVAPTGNR